MSDLRPGDRVDGRFVVERVIGEGGLARVYRVRHLDLGGTFALKLLIPRNRELAERLVVEGRIQAQLHHPNIVAVIDLVRHEGQLGLLMEYVDHQTLEHRLAARGALPLLEALDLLAPICSAVVAAHEAGITHRDLKPANVMLAQTPRGLVPKVADFGIAKVVDAVVLSGAAASRTLGTPGYLAPEQLTDPGGVDERADQFALGAIAWRLLAGRNVYEETDGAVPLGATLAPAPPLRDHAPDVPSHVADAIGRAMSLAREERFPDVRSFAAALLRDHPELFDLVDREPTGDRSITLDGVGRAVAGSLAATRAGGETLVAVSTPSFSEVPAAPTVILESDPPAPVPTRRSPLTWVAAVAGIVGMGAVGWWILDPLAPETVEAPPPVPAEPVAEVAEVPPPAAQDVPVADVPVVEPAPEAPSVPVVAAPVPDPDPPAVPVAEPVVAEPPPDDAPAEPPAPAVADLDLAEPPPAEVAPPPALPELSGKWTGKANNLPFALVFDGSPPPGVRATATFAVGAAASNVALVGTFDGRTLALRGAGFTFVGTWSAGRLSGTYHRNKGKDLPWSVAR